MLKCLLPYSEIFNTLFPEHSLPVQMSRTLRINAEPYEFEFQPARCALLIIHAAQKRSVVPRRKC